MVLYEVKRITKGIKWLQLCINLLGAYIKFGCIQQIDLDMLSYTSIVEKTYYIYI